MIMPETWYEDLEGSHESKMIQLFAQTPKRWLESRVDEPPSLYNWLQIYLWSEIKETPIDTS